MDIREFCPLVFSSQYECENHCSCGGFSPHIIQRMDKLEQTVTILQQQLDKIERMIDEQFIELEVDIGEDEDERNST